MLKADQLETQKQRVTGDFLEFIRYIWPEFIGGHHHKIFLKNLIRSLLVKVRRLNREYAT